MDYSLEREVRASLKPGFLIHGAPMDELLPNLGTGLRIGREMNPNSLTPDFVCFAILQRFNDPTRSLRSAQIYTDQNEKRVLAVIVDPNLLGPSVELVAVGSDLVGIQAKSGEIQKRFGYDPSTNTVFGIPVAANAQSYTHPDEARAKYAKEGIRVALIASVAIKACVLEMQDARYFKRRLTEYPQLHHYRWPVVALDGRLISPDFNPRNFSIPSEG